MTPDRIAELRDDPFSVRAREVRYLLDLAESHERLREALEHAYPVIAEQADYTGYGYARPDDPRDFHPDAESCSPEEIENHRRAVELWDAAGGRPDGWEPPRGSEWSDMGPDGVAHILRAPWGIGTYVMRDEAMCKLRDIIGAALSAAPKQKGGEAR